MPVRAVLWDIDGTLVDSEPLHWKAVVAATTAAGGTIHPGDAMASLGVSYGGVYRLFDDRHGLRLDFNAWLSAAMDHYCENVSALLPRPGALEQVLEFARMGLTQACVSNSPARLVKANVDHIHGLLGAHHFAFAVSRDDVPHGKPDPAPYLEAARRLGVAPAACVAIEDSPVGAASAVAAGMITVAWPAFPDLWFDGVTLVVDSLCRVEWDQLLRSSGLP